MHQLYCALLVLFNVCILICSIDGRVIRQTRDLPNHKKPKRGLMVLVKSEDKRPEKLIRNLLTSLVNSDYYLTHRRMNRHNVENNIFLKNNAKITKHLKSMSPVHRSSSKFESPVVAVYVLNEEKNLQSSESGEQGIELDMGDKYEKIKHNDRTTALDGSKIQLNTTKNDTNNKKKPLLKTGKENKESIKITDGKKMKSQKAEYLLRGWNGCNKSARKYCKKACKDTYKSVCHDYKCSKSMKKAFKSECKINCDARFS